MQIFSVISTAFLQSAPQLQPRRLAPRGICSVCGGNFVLRLDGNLRAHRAGGQSCIGSNSPANHTNGQTQIGDAAEIPVRPRNSAEDEQENIDQNRNISKNKGYTTTLKIKLSDDQRETLLKASFGTATLFEFHLRVARSITPAMAAAAFDHNYDPLIALKPVLANLPPHRRSEVLKRRLDAFEAGDVPALCAEAQKCVTTNRRQARPKCPSSREDIVNLKPNAAAMRSLAAGMPGRALRRLSENGPATPTTNAIRITTSSSSILGSSANCFDNKGYTTLSAFCFNGHPRDEAICPRTFRTTG